MKPLEKTLKQLAVVVMVLMITIPVKGQWGTNVNDIYNTNTGNVGIGTIVPGAKLEVSDAGNTTIRIKPASGVNNLVSNYDFWGTFYNYPDIGVRRVANIQAGFATGIWGTEYMAFGLGSNDAAILPTERMRITGSGYVGIGTTSPNYKLDIAGISGEVGLRVGDDGTKVFRMLWDNGVDEGVIDSWYGSAHHPIRISGSVIKLTGGYVGIGTINPGVKLTTLDGAPSNSMTLGANSGAFAVMGWDNKYGLFTGMAGDGHAWMQVGRNDLSESVYPLLLNPSGGNVGIGTTSATEKLTVNGKILAEEVQVVVDVPDYVFAKEYKLKTLSEVSKFINEHKHLPEVPSEKEVLDNCGQVSLGEMNMTLLKKIEELTLYAIEQDEVIKELLNQNETILKRVTELEKQ